MIRRKSSAASRMVKILFQTPLLWVALWTFVLSRDAESLAFDHSYAEPISSANHAALSTVKHLYLPLIKGSWAGGAINIRNRQAALEFFNDQYRARLIAPPDIALRVPDRLVSAHRIPQSWLTPPPVRSLHGDRPRSA
jgi:hypothetical protein